VLKSFEAYIKKEKLFLPTERVLLAVSGGVDSVVMMELFHRAGIEFAVAHCNFKLRGKESDGDEKLVRLMAAKYHVRFYSDDFDTLKYAKEKNISVQMAARELRYDFFETIREQLKFDYIATAHHQDDSVETFFINLIRGTGIAGLHGILPKQNKIVRPLLFASKDEIIAYAKKEKLKFREDSSNASDKYLRNRIRHHLVPMLKELNPDIDKTLMNEMIRLKEVEDIYKKEIENRRKRMVKKVDNQVLISIKELNKLSPLPSYLYEFLKPYNFNEDNTNKIISVINGEAGKQFISATHRLIKDRESLIIEKLGGANVKKVVIKIKKNQDEYIRGSVKLKFEVLNPGTEIIKSKNIAFLDFDKLKFPLELRKWREGDSFYPFGMKGKKKLSDFFINQKLSLIDKEKTWLLTSNGDIAWVAGIRIDERFKVTKATKKIYFAELVK
jgi:tRNA(Ile)-lysidine synthase